MAVMFVNCKCRQSRNMSAITCARSYPYYKQLHFHTHAPKGWLHTLMHANLQTTREHFSHIHTPTAQQVRHFAPNAIFQPISSIIALLIFKPPSVSDWSGNGDGCWAFFPLGSTCSLQPTRYTKAVCSSRPCSSIWLYVVCRLILVQLIPSEWKWGIIIIIHISLFDK